MDFCPNCGSMIMPGKTVCGRCGASKSDEITKNDRNTQQKPIKQSINLDSKLMNEYEKELNDNKEYFDNLHDVELDVQQRLACVVDRDNLQIVAGAGTGKTFTIISKIRYLIDKKHVNPKEILCMSFTNATVKDLKEKLPKGVRVYTFNGLGNLIVNRYSKEEIKDVVGDGNKEFRQILSEYIETASQRIKSDILDICENEFMSFQNKEKLKEIDDDDEKLDFALSNCTFIKFTRGFLSLYKSMGYGINDFSKLKQHSNEDILSKLIAMKNNKYLEIVKPFYLAYEGYLSKNHLIDYDDMINKSTKLIEEDECQLNYKYIFVDEYQDISVANYKFIKLIKDKTGAKLIVVGDDWQSIYGFRDSNVELFTNFDKYFPNSTKVFIETTYRNSQELIDVAGKFVYDTGGLIKKSLNSNFHMNKPIKVIYYSPSVDNGRYITDLIKKLSRQSEELLILGRHNNDIDKLIVDTDFKKRGNLSKDKMQRIYDKNDKSMDNVFYRTIHSAKGLEADNVIISAVTDDYLGFPNKIQTKSYTSLIHDWDDNVKQKEERRLFYVALTRSKNNVYIFTEYYNESKFVKEIIRDSPGLIEKIEIN